MATHRPTEQFAIKSSCQYAVDQQDGATSDHVPARRDYQLHWAGRI